MRRVLLDTNIYGKIVALGEAAAASLSALDIVVSEDNETMLNEIAMKCYRIVNQIKNIGTPQFISYKDFRKWFV